MAQDTTSNETPRPLEEVVREYVNARGKDNIVQLAVYRSCFETGSLYITAHTAVQGDLSDIITKTDVVTFHGRRYDLYFVEDPYGPHDHKRITLYTSGTIDGIGEVTLEEGLAAADDYMRDLLEREDSLRSSRVD